MQKYLPADRVNISVKTTFMDIGIRAIEVEATNRSAKFLRIVYPRTWMQCYSVLTAHKRYEDSRLPLPRPF
jgi:hypothetical protein